MEQIRQIFDALNRKEIRNFKHYLAAFHFRGPDNGLKIIELLEKDASISEEKIELKIFGKESKRVFRRLKSKLESQLFEFLVSSNNLDNNPRFKNETSLLNQVNSFQSYLLAVTLQKYGLGTISKKIVSDTIKEFGTSAQPLDKLLHFTLLQRLSAIKTQTRWDLDIEVDSAFNEFVLAWQARAHYEKLRLFQHEKLARQEGTLKMSKEAILDLQKNLEISYSPHAHYFFLKIEIILYLQEDNLVQAREAIRELIDLVKNNSGLNDPSRLINGMQQLIVLELQTGQFEEAYKLGLETQDLYPLYRKKQRVINASFILNACAFSDSLDEMESVLKQHFLLLDLSKPSIYADRLYYYKCSLLFMKGEYKDALKNLFSIKLIIENKSKFNNRTRIREIQLHINMNSLSLASSLIENQRKHLSRYEASPKFGLIHQCLRTLEKQSFNFQHPEMQEHLERISQSIKWEFSDYETIPFVTWLRSRVENIDLRQALREDVKRVLAQKNQ